MTSRLRKAAAVALTTVAALVSASPALAIDNGVPDGTNHPNVGLLAIEHDGIKDALVLGLLRGPAQGRPGHRRLRHGGALPRSIWRRSASAAPT